MLHIYSYNEHSVGAGLLATALGIRRIRRERSTYVGRPNKTVINWGSSQVPDQITQSRVLNQPARVAAMSNKRTFFEMMGPDVRTPEWTTDRAEAFRWMATAGVKVVARAVLNGHSGNGITIYENRNIFLDSATVPLYTKYVPKKLEYRIHFVAGEIIDIQRKIKDPARDVASWLVRSHVNGFIFVRNGVADEMPRDVMDQARATIAECGLDFGAIDIVYNGHQGLAFVLEINTAPGLSGETVQSYANAFRQFL